MKYDLYREVFPVDNETKYEECEVEEAYHPPPTEEVLEENIHEESFQEDLNDEYLDETSVSIFLRDEGEVIHPFLPPAHEDKKIIGFNATNDLVKDPFDMVDQHIDDFIHVKRCRWDVVCFTFDKDSIYNVEDISQTKGVELSSSRDWYLCTYDLDSWHPSNDMIIDFFQDDSSQHTHEDFQPPSFLDIDGYHVVANLEQSKVHATKRNNFHLESFYTNSWMKRQHLSFSRHETIPYLFSSSLMNHHDFLGSLMSHESSGSNDHANGYEYET
jgi:hypothetical protein